MKVWMRQDRAPHRAVGIAERFGEFEVVVALGVDELHRLPGGCEGGGEFLRLALEFRRLERAVKEHDRRPDARDVPLRR